MDSAEAARDAALGADIGEPPFFVAAVDPAPRDRREDLFERVDAVALDAAARARPARRGGPGRSRRGGRSGVPPPPSGASSRGSSCPRSRAARAARPTPSCARSGSSPTVGSSRNSTSGRLSSALAISRRRSIPPESVRARRSSIGSSRIVAIVSRDPLAALAARHARHAPVEVEVLVRGERAVHRDRLRDVADRSPAPADLRRARRGRPPSRAPPSGRAAS